MNNEFNLREMLRLFDTEHNSRSGAGRRIEKVRINAETLSERI